MQRWLLFGVAAAGVIAAPSNQSVAALDLLDLTGWLTLGRADFYEALHFVTALTALANRDGPAVYTLLTDADVQWWTTLRAGPWLGTTKVSRRWRGVGDVRNRFPMFKGCRWVAAPDQACPSECTVRVKRLSLEHTFVNGVWFFVC